MNDFLVILVGQNMLKFAEDLSHGNGISQYGRKTSDDQYAQGAVIKNDDTTSGTSTEVVPENELKVLVDTYMRELLAKKQLQERMRTHNTMLKSTIQSIHTIMQQQGLETYEHEDMVFSTCTMVRKKRRREQ